MRVTSDPRLIDTGPSGKGWSYYSTVNQCPQKFAFKYVDGADEAVVADSPRVRGSVLHGGLAHFYALRLKKDVYPWLNAMERIADSFGLDSRITAELQAVVRAYIAHYTYDTIEPLEVEKLLTGKIGSVIYTARVDLIARWRGRVWFVDHKSSWRPEPGLVTRYTLSGQFVGQSIFGRKLYDKEFGGILINALPSHTRDLGKRSFLRLPLPPAPGLTTAGFRTTIERASRTIEEFHGVALHDYPKAMQENTCITQYGPCAYYSRCQWKR